MTPRRAACVFLVLLLWAGSQAVAMDHAREEAGVDRAVAEFKVSGRGVLIATLDRGIDWENQDFRADDGSTRIVRMLDLTDDQGAGSPSNPYKVGTLYPKEAIEEALKGARRLPFRDAVGHGTTTAGIACGNGRNRTDRKYRGIAPQASLVVVKICSDGAPAHDGEAAEPYFYRPERVLVAIDFVRDVARKLGLPCVIVLNIGSQGGPTDGSSPLCRAIDALVGPGKQGLVFVTGPGDEGTSRKQNRLTIFEGKKVPVGTIWDGASARYNICPGDYVARTEWIAVDGIHRSHDTEGRVGEIWKGSSVGPTADGRLGVDFCAPGDSVFTTYAPRSYWATFAFNLVQGGNHPYGRASAVSAANPITAGVIALMLEMDPRLDAAIVKDLLQRTARKDAFTGTTPNVTWGYGKLDAYAALKAVQARRIANAGSK